MKNTDEEFIAYSSHAVANAFLSLANKKNIDLTNMQVQKLVYIAQGYSLALLDRPLYKDNIYAWQWGPVITRLYQALRKYGNGVVENKIRTEDEIPKDSEEMQIIEGVFEGYGHLSGGRLSSLTHRSESPWSSIWEEDKFGPIPIGIIKNYYKEKVNSKSK